MVPRDVLENRECWLAVLVDLDAYGSRRMRWIPLHAAIFEAERCQSIQCLVAESVVPTRLATTPRLPNRELM